LGATSTVFVGLTIGYGGMHRMDMEIRHFCARIIFVPVGGIVTRTERGFVGWLVILESDAMRKVGNLAPLLISARDGVTLGILARCLRHGPWNTAFRPHFTLSLTRWIRGRPPLGPCF
jgi:hypothetical protein